jgi:hypothetical protein
MRQYPFYKLFDALAITDTVWHDSDTVTLQGYSRARLNIRNDLSQAVVVVMRYYVPYSVGAARNVQYSDEPLYLQAGAQTYLTIDLADKGSEAIMRVQALATPTGTFNAILELFKTPARIGTKDIVLEEQSLGALNAELVLNVGAYQAFSLQVRGTFAATLSFEAMDLIPTPTVSAEWQAAGLQPVGGGALVTSATAPGLWYSPPGFQARSLRIRVSAYTSGTAYVTVALRW